MFAQRVGNRQHIAYYQGAYWFYEGIDGAGDTILRDLKDHSLAVSVRPSMRQPRVLAGDELQRCLSAVAHFT